MVGLANSVLRLQFDPLTVAEEEMLTMVLFSRADSWLGWGESREVDQPLRSLGRIIRIAFRGLGMAYLVGEAAAQRARASEGPLTAESLLAVVLGLGLAGWGARARAQTDATRGTGYYGDGAARRLHLQRRGQRYCSATPVAGSFRTEQNLFDLGVTGPINLRGTDAYDTIYFSIPQNEVVKQASMHLYYHFSPSLIPSTEPLEGDAERDDVRDAAGSGDTYERRGDSSRMWWFRRICWCATTS